MPLSTATRRERPGDSTSLTPAREPVYWSSEEARKSVIVPQIHVGEIRTVFHSMFELQVDGQADVGGRVVRNVE